MTATSAAQESDGVATHRISTTNFRAANGLSRPGSLSVVAPDCGRWHIGHRMMAELPTDPERFRAPLARHAGIRLHGIVTQVLC